MLIVVVICLFCFVFFAQLWQSSVAPRCCSPATMTSSANTTKPFWGRICPTPFVTNTFINCWITNSQRNSFWRNNAAQKNLLLYALYISLRHKIHWRSELYLLRGLLSPRLCVGSENTIPQIGQSVIDVKSLVAKEASAHASHLGSPGRCEKKNVKQVCQKRQVECIKIRKKINY